MHTVTFFVTTARSGTQWVCESLREAYSDLLVVEHEPIKYAYAPKLCLRNPAALAELRMRPTVRRHLDNIHETLKHKSYVEVGFPAFAAAPLLWEEFGTRLRLVQLVRHPVRVAASIVTHRWFDPGQRLDIQADIALTPQDPGVCMGHYAARWPYMSPFEKALFNWAEVHLYGLEIRHALTAVPNLQVSFEDLLASNDVGNSFTEFLEIPHRSGWGRASATRMDRYQKKTTSKIDCAQIHTLPEIAELAERFGYNLEAVSERAVRLRYRESASEKTRRVLKRALKRAFKRVFAVGAPVACAFASNAASLAIM